MNTNLLGVFNLILTKGIENHLTQDDMPDSVLIISDMEFDQACGRQTNYESIKSKYLQAGYAMPNLVFWNVNGRVGNSPVKYDTKGTALVSGASPSIIKSLLGGEDMTPMGIMLKTLNSERYAAIV